MQIIQILIIFFLFPAGNSQDQVATEDSFWRTNYQSAVAEARAEKKVVMLYFAGSDWCKPCILMKRDIFDTELFHTFAGDNLVPVKLDFPRLKKHRLPAEQMQQNESLADRFNHEGTFPLIVFLDVNEKLIEKSGYRAGGPDEFISYAESFLSEPSQ
jgi:thioredoxin-related protein